jgi:hypothetical protein
MSKAVLVAVGSTVAVIVFMHWVPTPLNRNIVTPRPPSDCRAR